jgi:S-adenosylmethionine uptake transporter
VLRVHLARGLVSLPDGDAVLLGPGAGSAGAGDRALLRRALLSLYLAAALLGERIERGAVIASLLGFGGVLLIFWGQAEADLGAEAVAGSIAILCSAGLYAYNIILMRRQALLAGPVEWPFFISGIMATGFGLAAPVLAEAPAPHLWPAIVGAALLAFGSLMLLSWAYARAEAQHLAPVEYTSFIWAAILGFLFFSEHLRPFTVAGAVLIVVGCIIAARRRPPPDPDVEAGVHA